MSEGVALALVRMGGRACAIPCEHIVEIVPRVLLSRVPDSPPQVLGVINLRGRVVPVVDVRAKLAAGGDSSPLPPYQHLVIVQAEARQVGLAVDEVNEVRSVPSTDVEKPGDLARATGPGVVRIDRDLVLVVSPEDVLHAIG
jgi:purine-binding chemotaxis protein CheW